MSKQTSKKKTSTPTNIPTARGKKRARAAAAPAPAPKRTKTTAAAAAINTIPTQRLDVYVFGTAMAGELGLGARAQPGLQDPTLASRPHRNERLRALPGGGVVQVSVGGIHCAALTGDGRVVTWGANDTGNLGRDTAVVEGEDGDGTEGADSEEGSDEVDLNPKESEPTIISAENFKDGGEAVRFVQVLALDNATFALSEDGRVWGWGTFRGSEGNFGFLRERIPAGRKPKDDEMRELRPVLIKGLSNIKELAGGTNHVLALTHDGNVYGWGSGQIHELGRILRLTRSTTLHDSLVPDRVPLPKNKITNVSAGSHSSFAIDTTGRVFAWGLNNRAQTGIPPTAAQRLGKEVMTVVPPKVVKSLVKYNIKHIASGTHHAVACTTDGVVLVWGRCDEGQAGLPVGDLPPADFQVDSRGRPVELTMPTVVPGVTASFVAAGIDCSMAVAEDGRVFTWGYSEGYRTGLGTEDTPDSPELLRGAVAGKKITWAECGGQFSMVAGPADAADN